MKFHLPKKLFVAVMAAMLSTQVYAETEQTGEWITIGKGQYTYSEVNGTAYTQVTGDLTSTAYDGGIADKTGYDANGVIGGVRHDDADRGATNTDITIGDGTTETKVTEVIGAGPYYYAVTGNKTITVKDNATVGVIVGATEYTYHHNSGYTDTYKGKGATSYYNNGNYFSPKTDKDATISINVEGGIVGQIRGGNNTSSTVVGTEAAAAKKAIIKKHSDAGLTGDALNEAVAADLAKYLEDPAWASNEKIVINVTGGKVGYKADGTTAYDEPEAIIGAGGNSFSVNNAVEINISGDAEILGDIYAGAKSKVRGGVDIQAYIESSAITIAGGNINGNVYGGGVYDDSNIKSLVKNGTSIILSGGSVQKDVYAGGDRDEVRGGTQITISGVGTDVAGTIHGGGTEGSTVVGSRTLTVDSSYTGTQAYKVADFTDIAVNADATLAEMTEAKEGTSISIADGKTLKLTGDKTYTAGNATGGTIYVDGANFELSSADSKLTSDVVLDKHASLDLNGAAVNNTIWVYGCSIKGAESFSGHLIVDGGELELTEPTSADKVTVTNGGSVTGGSLAANKVELIGTNDGAQQPDINTNLSVADNGTITLSGGAVLNVDGSLTLGSGVNIVVGDDYAVGTEIIKVSGDINQEENIEIIFGETKVVVQNGGVWLISRFDQNYADTFTMGNWGIITASRAFVDTVRGQRTNVGCIANGRGTAWAAVMGGNHDIAGSDINLFGAAVGADMKVGHSSSVGVALGYVDGDVKPGSLRTVDQDGAYLAFYGEHGLEKLDATSCLSFDWVAAYGNTESSVAGHKWEQDSLQLNSRLNWNKRINNKTCVTAFGGLEYFASNSDTVAGMKTGSMQCFRGEIGVGARYVALSTPNVYDNKSGLVLAKGCEKLVFNGEIRYINDLERSNPVIRMEGMSGGSTNPGRQGMGIEAGATYRINERWSASANYGFNAMDDSKEHRINAGAAYTF